MTNDNPTRQTEPVEGNTGTPPPEKGSPTPAEGGSGAPEDDATQNDASDGNPLGPPVNTHSGT